MGRPGGLRGRAGFGPGGVRARRGSGPAGFGRLRQMQTWSLAPPLHRRTCSKLASGGRNRRIGTAGDAILRLMQRPDASRGRWRRCLHLMQRSGRNLPGMQFASRFERHRGRGGEIRPVADAGGEIRAGSGPAGRGRAAADGPLTSGLRPAMDPPDADRPQAGGTPVPSPSSIDWRQVSVASTALNV